MKPSFVIEEDYYDDMSFTSEPDLDLQAYIKVWEDETINYIRKFFNGKSYYCGGPIPARKLYSEASVDVVLGTRFGRGVRIAYHMLRGITTPQSYKGELKNYHMFLILNIVKEIKKHLVPVPCQAGLLLLYLKFCKGLVIPSFAIKKRK